MRKNIDAVMTSHYICSKSLTFDHAFAGRNPYCIDKNYAGILIIWDRMFGKFCLYMLSKCRPIGCCLINENKPVPCAHPCITFM